LAKSKRKEAVSVSFHYLCRQEAGHENEIDIIPFSQTEFSDLCDKLENIDQLDLSVETNKDAVRYKNIVPITFVDRVNTRTLFGIYKGCYWGHAYENTDRGNIPADSISLRPFYFLLYLSTSGRIYIGTQYLAQFGSYMGLKSTIVSMLSNRENIVPHSFRFDSATYENLHPKEVRISIARQSSDIASDNVFLNGAVVAFRKMSGDDGFEEQVKKRIMPFLGTEKSKVQKAISSILNEANLIDISDDEISDCTIIGTVNGRRKSIYLMEQSSFATQFPLNVPLNQDGHPTLTETKNAMLDILEKQIISRSENV
jgi:hypothetical protein